MVRLTKVWFDTGLSNVTPPVAHNWSLASRPVAIVLCGSRYYMEDGTLAMTEPRVENSGMERTTIYPYLEGLVRPEA